MTWLRGGKSGVGSGGGEAPRAGSGPDRTDCDRGMNKLLEQRLIKKAAAGDREASGMLVKSYQGQLYAYILRLSGRPELAEDVVQEAFIRALTNLDRFDSRFRFSTWLFTIGRRVFLNIAEKRKPRSDSDRVDMESAPLKLTSAAEMDDERGVYRDAVQAALMVLPIDQREVVVLFHMHDWPIWLIAEHLSMPEGTVKSHLHRGRERLRVALLAAPGQRGRVVNTLAAELVTRHAAGRGHDETEHTRAADRLAAGIASNDISMSEETP